MLNSRVYSVPARSIYKEVLKATLLGSNIFLTVLPDITFSSFFIKKKKF